MAIVTGEEAWFTGGNNMIAHNIATGKEDKEETWVSISHGEKC